MKYILGAAVLLCVLVLSQAEFEEKNFSEGGSGDDVDKNWTDDSNSLKILMPLTRRNRNRRAWDSWSNSDSLSFERVNAMSGGGNRKRRALDSSGISNSVSGEDSSVERVYNKPRGRNRKRRAVNSSEGSNSSSGAQSSVERVYDKPRGGYRKKRAADNAQ